LWPNHTSVQILLLENTAAGASLSHTVAPTPEVAFLLVRYFTHNHPLQEKFAKQQLCISTLPKTDFEAMNLLTRGAGGVGVGVVKIKAHELHLSTERKPENFVTVWMTSK